MTDLAVNLPPQHSREPGEITGGNSRLVGLGCQNEIELGVRNSFTGADSISEQWDRRHSPGRSGILGRSI